MVSGDIHSRETADEGIPYQNATSIVTGLHDGSSHMYQPTTKRRNRLVYQEQAHQKFKSTSKAMQNLIEHTTSLSDIMQRIPPELARADAEIKAYCDKFERY